MGLAIVRSIIEPHGGTITGENAGDRGARMIVRLPAAQGEIQKSKAAAWANRVMRKQMRSVSWMRSFCTQTDTLSARI